MGKYTTKLWEERYLEWLERMGRVYGEMHAMFLRRWLNFVGVGRVDASIQPDACSDAVERLTTSLLSLQVLPFPN